MKTAFRLTRVLPVALLATAVAAPAFAHNLILEAYTVSGGKSIEGDAFFSDGTLVKGATIVISDDAGKVILEVKTDGKGNFAYTPSQPVTQHLSLDAGAGHVANVVIAAAKLAGGSAGPAVAAAVAAAPAGAPAAAAAAGGNVDAAVQARIASMVAAEIEPLQTEVETYRGHNDQMNLLAAIGLLCGFGGVLLFSAGAQLVKATSSNRNIGAARTGVRS